MLGRASTAPKGLIGSSTAILRRVRGDRIISGSWNTPVLLEYTPSSQSSPSSSLWPLPMPAYMHSCRKLQAFSRLPTPLPFMAVAPKWPLVACATMAIYDDRTSVFAVPSEQQKQGAFGASIACGLTSAWLVTGCAVHCFQGMVVGSMWNLFVIG